MHPSEATIAPPAPLSSPNAAAPQRDMPIPPRAFVVSGALPRIARLRSEYFVPSPRPEEARSLLPCDLRADLFSFPHGISAEYPKVELLQTLDAKAVLPLTTYDEWWTRQINDKTRNMVRKAGKKGVVLRECRPDARFIEGIKAIYDESPIRQGRPFAHYGKDIETLTRAHETYADRSDFVGAYLGDTLIGFIKLVHLPGYSALMQIISCMSHRDKAPTNALLAKAVEICTSRNVPFLMYGMWSRRSLGDFKIHHGFKKMEIPRYWIPLTWRGSLVLRLNLHREVADKLIDRIPDKWLRFLADIRNRWHLYRCRPQAN